MHTKGLVHENNTKLAEKQWIPTRWAKHADQGMVDDMIQYPLCVTTVTSALSRSENPQQVEHGLT